jgi:hypothetical protein
MARIRTIKPEFNSSASVARMSVFAQLFMVKLLTEADDHGKMAWLPKRIAGILYPYDENVSGADIEAYADELESEGILERYEVDGQRYARFPKWTEHQRVDRPSKSNYPNPGNSNPPEPLDEPSRNTRETLATNTRLEQGTGNREKETTTAATREISKSPPDESPPMSPLAAKLAPILQQIPAVDRCGLPGLDGIDEVLTDYGEEVKVKDWPEVAKSCRDHFRAIPAFGVGSVKSASAAGLLREFVRERWLARNGKSHIGKSGSRSGLDEIPDEVWEKANQAVTGGR